MSAPAVLSQPTPPRAAEGRRRLVALLHGQGALVALLGLCVFAAVRYESFLTPENLFNVLRQNSMMGLVALGMTFVILTGGIDLSVGALLAVGGVVGAALSGDGLVVALPAAVGVTALLGAGNGLLVTRGRIQPFITTLVVGLAARGVLLALTGDESVRVAREAVGVKGLGRGWVGPVPVPVLVLLAAYLVGWLVLARTRYGRHVYAAGDNDEAARLMGLNVDGVRVGAYGISGALAGLAGVLLAGRIGVGQPVAGAAWELGAITAVVVGGTSLAGGQGGAPGTLVGLLLLGVTFNVFNLEGAINSYWQWVLRGVFLLLVVVVQDRLAARAG